MSSDKSKTETIKERRVDVYLPSLDMKDEWKERAEKRDQSVSKFVIEMVEDGIAREEEENYEDRATLIERKKELQEQFKELQKENNRLKTLVDKQEKELREYRSKPFTEEDFEGKRELPEELINILREQGKVRYEDLHNLMDIEPGSDKSVALQNQIDTLEEYNLIEHTDRYLRWKG